MLKKFKFDFIILLFLIFIISILFSGYIFYKNIKDVNFTENISIKINNLELNDLNSIKFYLESPNKNMIIIPRDLNDIWKIDHRYASKLYICFINEKIKNKYFYLKINIGEKEFDADKNIIFKDWKNKDLYKKFKTSGVIYQFPDYIHLSKSKINIFSTIINWKGDTKVFQIIFFSTFILIFIIILLFLLYISLIKKIDFKIIDNYLNRDLIVIPAIIIFSLIIKILTLETIEISGDAVWTWFNIKTFINGLGVQQWDHHTTRLGKNILLSIFQLIFGSKALIYYIAPVLMSVISSVMIYKIGKIVLNARLGLLSCFFFLFFSELTRASSQLIPSIFSICYMTISIFFLVKYLKVNKKIFLILSSLFLFIAYLAEVTNVFFIPGIIIALYINNNKNIKNFIFNVFIYGFILLILFLIETFIYYKITGNVLGRIGIIKNYHIDSMNFFLNNFFQIFDRFLKLSTNWFIVFFTFLFISIVLLIIKTDKIIKSIIAIIYSFFILITFSISKFKPLMPSLKFNDRYLDVCLPFMFIVITFFIIVILKYTLVRFNDFIKNKNINLNLCINYYFNLLLIFLFVFYFYINIFDMKFSVINNSIIKTIKYENEINSAYENNIPIVIVENDSYDADRFYKCLIYAFLYNKYWLENKKINFPMLQLYQEKNLTLNYILNHGNLDNFNKENNILLISTDNKNLNNFKINEIKYNSLISHFDFFRN